MEKNLKLKILNSIGKIYEESKDCKLENSFFKKIDKELEFLSEYFGTTKSQSFLIAVILSLNYKGRTVDLNDLIVYFDCTPTKILEYSDDFEHLYNKGVLKKEKSGHRMNLAGANDLYTINEKISEAILKSKAMPEIKQEKIEDVIELLEKIYNFSEQRDVEEISTGVLLAQSKKLITENLHFPFIKKVNRFNFDIEDTYLYLYLIWKTISGNESVDIGRALEEIYDNPTRRIRYMQKILSNENILLKNNLIELVEAGFFNDTEMKLSDKSIDILNEFDIKTFLNKKKKDNVLLPDKIPVRKLIFSKQEMQQLFLLKDMLDDAKLKEVQNRLTQKNLPKGITALLHGAPGTGKTEVVKQIAKETNRELMKVDISKSKSMWFGESEKLIKKIFTDYKALAKTCERTPILLFNEADAIISKRRALGNSSVAQTENAIQNILLEELENFEGILIATTNLASNLDSAFERRFLFKIKFNKPDTKTRAEIWKLKLPFLDMKDCIFLAEKFDFSGGQIDNIVRKVEINEVINGKKVNLDDLMLFCSEEKLENKTNRKIGFTN